MQLISPSSLTSKNKSNKQIINLLKSKFLVSMWGPQRVLLVELVEQSIFDVL